MAQYFTIYPLGNAETCLLELNNGSKLLFDYAAMNDGSSSDARFNIEDNITKKEVIEYSPSLADKVARNTAVNTVEEIAGEIAEVIRHT